MRLLSPRLNPSSRGQGRRRAVRQTYPEVNFEVSTSSKLPVADLEGNGHQIILVQGLVEAFAGVSFELDGVCGRGGGPPQRGDEEGSGGEAHS
jgi:hypothetical protein